MYSLEENYVYPSYRGGKEPPGAATRLPREEVREVYVLHFLLLISAKNQRIDLT